MMKRRFTTHAVVVQLAPAGKKVFTHRGRTVADLEPPFRREPVGAPRLVAAAFPTNPVAQQISLVGIGIVIDPVPVNVGAVNTAGGKDIRVDSFNPQVEFG